MSDTHLTQTRFDSFALDPRILAGLADAGFTHCTPIQAETLPIALEGHDVAGQAQTGTGKTAAFLLVVMQRLLSQTPAPHGQKSRPRALVLAPTRELAVQIHKDTLLLSRHTGLRAAVVYGGTGYQQQRDDLSAGVDILIGTPGRLIDYYKQHVFDLKGIEAVVLDEADRMFDLGFIKDIRYLFRQMPSHEKRQGMLFSATLSYRVTELAYEHMNQPRLVKIETEQVTADRVRQVCYMTANEEKIPLLLGLIRGWPDGRIIVFVNTKREADRVWGYLQGNGINTAVLSGDVPQKKRLKLLRDFTDGTLPVLVGTDVAARGLHIPDVTHVVNYDLPEDPEDYVHRIGRTARAGATGDAIGFVCETHAFCLPDIEAYIGAKIPVRPVEPELLAEVNPRSRLRPDREDREPRREGRGPRERSSERRPSESRRPDRTRDARAPRTAETPPPQVDVDAVAAPPPPAPQATEGEPARPPRRSRRRPDAGSTPQPETAVEPRDAIALIDDPVWVDEPEEDMPPARRPRRSRHKVEVAALTSPPPPASETSPRIETTTPAVASADITATDPSAPTGESKPKRRRRRRKPASAAGGTDDAARVGQDSAPERLETVD